MYLLVLFLIIWTLSPGPVAALTLDRSKRHGQSAGIAVAVGATLSTALLLGAVIMTHLRGFDILLNEDTSSTVEGLGALLIVVMGLAVGYKALISTQGEEPTKSDFNPARRSFFHGMMMITASIPQSIIFYILLVPQSVPAAQVTAALISLGTLKILLMLVWHSALSMMVHRVHEWLDRPSLSRNLDFATASFLVLFGINILV